MKSKLYIYVLNLKCYIMYIINKFTFPLSGEKKGGVEFHRSTSQYFEFDRKYRMKSIDTKFLYLSSLEG